MLRIMAYYAVRSGRIPGIYRTWTECESQVKNFPKCRYKKFNTEGEALNFINSGSSTTVLNKRKTCDLSHSVEANDVYPISSSNTNLVQKNLVHPSGSKKESFYAVHRGKRPGVYKTWTECETQISNSRNAAYRKFSSEEEALEFVRTGGIAKVTNSQAKKLKVQSDFSEVETCSSVEDIVFDPETVYSVFTDGASSKNGTIDATAGIGVFWGPNHPLNTSMPLAGRQTNNRAEIYAATYALKQAKQFGAKKIKLYSDSQFMIKGITQWIQNWRKKGWVLSNGGPVKNKDDFMELDKAREGLDVEFVYIKAHASLPGNTEADRLAVEGAKKDKMEAFVILT